MINSRGMPCLGSLYSIYFFCPNVRGQGTAHLVRCTLDPIVGALFFISDFNRGNAIGFNHPYAILLLSEYLRGFAIPKYVLGEVPRKRVNNRYISIFVTG